MALAVLSAWKCDISWCYTECACDVVRQVEAVRRIKGDECRYEVDRIEGECVSYQCLHFTDQFPAVSTVATSP